MANLFDNTNRKVIPNWRSFSKTSSLGELDSFHSKFKTIRKDLSIVDYLDAWKINKNTVYASDLLSAAVVNNLVSHQEVINAAKFILNNKEDSSFSQITLAESILHKKEEINFSDGFSKINSETLLELSNPEVIRQRILFFRNAIREHPFNAIYYVEISRYFSILDLKEKAIAAMKVALHLSPNNRFVLRSAVRLFTHFEEIDLAHNLLRRNPITNIDPWLTSAEISLAMIRNRSSTFIKKGIELLNSNNITPFSFTELASSIGTFELLNGSSKKSRAMFTKALLSPNDNSLAQVEWASKKDHQLDINPSSFDVQLNFEALTLESLHHYKFEEALNNAAKWFIDMPYSTRPIAFASNLACTVMHDYKKAIIFLKAGLKNHPTDALLLNNYAYALSLDDRPMEALDQLNKVRKDQKTDISIELCLKATKGLTNFRLGNLDIGREFYKEVMEQTKAHSLNNLSLLALLNYAREEIRCKSKYVDSIIDVIHKIRFDSEEIDIQTLKNDVEEDYKKLKNGN